MLVHSVYYVGYVTKKKTEYNINSVNPLYLIIYKTKGHFKKKDGHKYLTISSENSDAIKKCQEVFDRLKEIIKKDQ